MANPDSKTSERNGVGPSPRRFDPALAVVVVVALGVGFAGIAHEVGTGYYDDEGHYLHRAHRVADGEWLFRSFIYPHLLYYLDGLVLAVGERLPGLATGVAALFGVEDPAAVDWLLLRLLSAAFGSLTAVPVYLLGRRVAGRLGGLLAAGLMVFSASYHAGFHVNICDVPSAFFAACCLAAVGRLLDEERPTDYLLAGIAAGLAAASKYPAGVVAVAIIGVWIRHRWRRRDLRWGLLWAGLIAMAVFVAANPSLIAFPDAAWRGDHGFFFGLRQYGEGGWIGVTPPSNAAWYGRRLLVDFGWPVWLLLIPGVVALTPAARSRWMALLPFPIVFLALMSSMSMVVGRNLFPVLPALAVLAGSAVAGLLSRWSRLPNAGRWLAAAGIAGVLALPASATLRQAVQMSRPSTREVMTEWIRANVPRGSWILKGSYTSDLPLGEYATAERRMLIRFPERRFTAPDFDFALLADHAYHRFFRPENDTPYQAGWYRDFFARHELVHEIRPERWRRGPRLSLYRLVGQDPEPADRRVFAAGDVVAPPGVAVDADADGQVEELVLRHAAPVYVKGSYAAGPHVVILDGEAVGDGRIVARALDGRRLGEAPIVGGRAELELEAHDSAIYKTIFELTLPAGSRLRTITVAAAEATGRSVAGSTDDGS